MLVDLAPPPGLNRNGTEYSSSGQNTDGKFIRWNEGILQPMGGWDQLGTGLVGNPRNLHTWTDDDFAAFIGVGTHSGLYSATSAGTITDRTPVGFTSDADGIWTLGNLGETLYACMDTDETIYSWQAGASGVAAAVSNAPTADAVVITEFGFVVALGAGGDPRVVRTSNLRQPTVWTPSSTNQARSFTIQTSGKLMGGVQVRGATLLLTDQDAHAFIYTGTGPNYHRLEKIPGFRGVISRNGAAAVDTRAFIMGRKNFYLYNGFMQALPCTIEDDVFSNINEAHAHKVQCSHNADQQEIWWLYPRGSETENSHAAIYNYAEGHWNHMEWDRACGVGPGGGFDNPIMVEGAAIYTHETGFTYDGSLPFLETGWFELGEGDFVMDCFQMIPDEKTAGEVEVTVRTRFYPNDTEYSFGPYQSANPMGVRFSGRQAQMVIQGKSGTDWRVGAYRADVQRSGEE